MSLSGTGFVVLINSSRDLGETSSRVHRLDWWIVLFRRTSFDLSLLPWTDSATTENTEIKNIRWRKKKTERPHVDSKLRTHGHCHQEVWYSFFSVTFADYSLPDVLSKSLLVSCTLRVSLLEEKLRSSLSGRTDIVIPVVNEERWLHLEKSSRPSWREIRWLWSDDSCLQETDVIADYTLT